MGALRGLTLRLRGLLRRSSSDGEFDEEIRFHIENETARHVRAGLTQEEARRRALVAFGGVALTREMHHDGWGLRSVEDLIRDTRHGLRGLVRNPVIATAAVTTLALGIGANTAIFSALNAVILRPLPFREPDRLVMLWEENLEKGWHQQVAAPANVLDWRERVPAFSDVTAYEEFDDTATLTGVGEPRLVPSSAVMGNLFSVLDVEARLGRPLIDRETWDSGRPVAVISERLWRTVFASDPAIVGRSVTLDDQPTEVVGVMPESFAFPSADIDIWMPFGWDPAQRTQVPFRRAHWVRAVARLAPGVSLQEARVQMQSVAAALQREFPETNAAADAGLTPLHEFVMRDSRGPVLILMGAVALLLLMACANVGNLLLVRASGRDRETALRLSLGAGRVRLVRQALTESVVLSVVGGIAGAGVGWLGTWAFERLRPSTLVHLGEVAVDWRVLGYGIAITCISGLVFGAAPAAWCGRRQPADVLRQVGRGSSRQAGQWASVLVSLEIASAILLAVGAGLLVRSFVALQRVHPGFDSRGVLTMALNPQGGRYDTNAERTAFYQELLARIRALPGVESAAAISDLPLTATGWTSDFAIAGRSPDDFGIEAAHREVTADYFRTMRVPVLRGREFTEQDRSETMPVVVINESLARRHFQGQDPIGQQVAFTRAPGADTAWRTIVGVVADERQGSLAGEAPLQFSEPFDQRPSNSMHVVMRSVGVPSTLIGPVRSLVADLDQNLPIAALRTMDQVRVESLERERFLLALLLAFAVVGGLLAIVGVYGVMAQFARSRAREMGIRLALGASPGAVRRLVFVRGLKLAAVGTTIGIGSAVAATGTLRAFLFNVEPTDPITFAGVAVLLFVTAMTATSIPAWRVSRTNPATTMRDE